MCGVCLGVWWGGIRAGVLVASCVYTYLMLGMRSAMYILISGTRVPVCEGEGV